MDSNVNGWFRHLDSLMFFCSRKTPAVPEFFAGLAPLPFPFQWPKYTLLFSEQTNFTCLLFPHCIFDEIKSGFILLRGIFSFPIFQNYFKAFVLQWNFLPSITSRQIVSCSERVTIILHSNMNKTVFEKKDQRLKVWKRALVLHSRSFIYEKPASRTYSSLSRIPFFFPREKEAEIH